MRLDDFVERAEEFFGREMTKPGIRKKLKKFGDFDIDKGIVTPSTDEEEAMEEPDE